MINLEGIKAIIFDLGGVIINIDYQLTISAFEKLGVKDFKNQYSKQKQSDLFDALEVGKISKTQFVQTIKQDLDLSHCTEGQVLSAWNALLLDFPQSRLNLLKELSTQLPLYLLSNTNEIHIDCFHEILKKQTGESSLNSYFNKVYFSSEIGMRKPNANVFEFVLTQHNLDPKTTLFIDDSIQHIQGAQLLGIKTHHLKDEEEITALF